MSGNVAKVSAFDRVEPRTARLEISDQTVRHI